jgi:ParB family chromosome partitioning protein
MAGNARTNIKLPTVDDLFTTQAEREGMNGERVQLIPIESIQDFPNHPFQIRKDEAMQRMIESIAENGVRIPALVRPMPDGQYQMVSGHRRKEACRMLGIDGIQAIVRDMTDDEATICMVESNYQRESVLPSERAFSYKMQLEAMKRQGKRVDLTSDQIGQKLTGGTSREELAQGTGKSPTQIQRFIRLTVLIPPLLQMVDDKEIALNPAVALSYLAGKEQEDLLETMKSEERTPSLSQAMRMKALSIEGKLDMDAIFSVMTEEKANQKEQVKLSKDKIGSFFPKSYSIKQMEETIFKLLTDWQRKRERDKSLER